MAAALEAEIDELLSIISRASSGELCCWIAALWTGNAPDIARQTGLSSPARQLSYLQGLLAATAEPIAPSDLSGADYQSIVRLLNSIADSYVHSHLEAAITGAVDVQKAQTASLAFIQRYMAGRLAVAEQLDARVRALHVPFDEQLATMRGISASEALEITK